MRSANRAPARRRRGVVSVAMIVLLIIVDLIVVGMVMGGVRDLELTVRAMDTLQAFYASEGGMNMAVREWIVNADEDGDGGTGTISNDSDDATDPDIGNGYVAVTTDGGSPETLSSTGRSGEAKRKIDVVAE